MPKTKAERTSQITIRMDPKILTGLDEIGARLGIAPTTLAGMAIGDWVTKTQAAYVNASQMHDTMARELAQIIAAPMASLLRDKTPQELKEMFHD